MSRDVVVHLSGTQEVTSDSVVYVDVDSLGEEHVNVFFQII